MVWRSAEDIASSGGKKDSFLYNYTKRQIDERENAEALRLLYVALTRAESHIVISDPSGLGGKTNKQQKLLSDHIADLEAGTAPKWLMHEKIGKNEYRLLLDALMSRIGGVKGDAHQIRPLEWLTTASLDFANELAVAPMTRASDHDRDETTVATLQENPWKVLKPNDAGTLIHMMLEWPELEQEVLDQRLRYELEGLDYSRQDGITDDITLLKWHADNARAYLRSNFPDARQFISEMPVEAWLDGGQSKSGEWLRGTIDLLIEDADGIWHLIDFKTAKVPEGQLKDHVVKNKYNVQLKHYLAALAAVSSGAIQVKPSQAVLLFTAFDQGRSIALAEF
jgi:ATP-dependent exoDNAse (exonuclease V) beta subunit